MYSVELKIKRKSLANEARDIRKEEQRAKIAKDTAKLNNLHFHRMEVVRRAARAAHLAHAILRGKAYHTVERTAKSTIPFARVMADLKKFGNYPQEKKELNKLIMEWVEGGTGLAVGASNPQPVGSIPTALS